MESGPQGRVSGLSGQPVRRNHHLQHWDEEVLLAGLGRVPNLGAHLISPIGEDVRSPCPLPQRNHRTKDSRLLHLAVLALSYFPDRWQRIASFPPHPEVFTCADTIPSKVIATAMGCHVMRGYSFQGMRRMLGALQ